MHVMQATTNLGVIETANADDTILPPKVAVTPGPLPTIYVPGYQGPLHVTSKLGVLPRKPVSSSKDST